MKASVLNQILDQHKLWIESSGVQGERAYLVGANLRDANLTRADLEDANLTGAYLEGAYLLGANLTGADLEGAYLRDANLRDAYLVGANLRDANLIGADLEDANLRDANLIGAYLEGAYLTYANLTGANLSYVNLTGAILSDISWIIPGCLVQLNRIQHDGFWLKKEEKCEIFVQDSLGFFIQDNPAEGTFDMLLGDRIIRNIPGWVKYTGLKQVS
jgi:hypothetical protein